MKRSVVVSGHRTSISLEPEFWAELAAIARRRDISLNALITEIDGARAGNLSSAARVYVLREIKRAGDSGSDESRG